MPQGLEGTKFHEEIFAGKSARREEKWEETRECLPQAIEFVSPVAGNRREI